SALRVHHRKLSGRSGGLGDSLRTIGLPPELPRRFSRRTGRLIVVRFHIPFWRRVRSSGGKQKSHFPRAEEMANYRERLLTDSPTGPSFSTARRERSCDLSHVRETLNPGVPGNPDEHLSTPEGSGLFAARTPRLPRILANRVNQALTCLYPSTYKITPPCKRCQEKLKVRRKSSSRFHQWRSAWP